MASGTGRKTRSRSAEAIFTHHGTTLIGSCAVEPVEFALVDSAGAVVTDAGATLKVVRACGAIGQALEKFADSAVGIAEEAATLKVFHAGFAFKLAHPKSACERFRIAEERTTLVIELAREPIGTAIAVAA